MQKSIIKLLKNKYNLKQIDIAKILDVAQNTISRKENNQINLTMKEIEKIANHLKISVASLINDNINSKITSKIDKIDNDFIINNNLLEEVVKKYNNNNNLKTIEIKNNDLSPYFEIGDTLVIDTSIAEFNKEGYYLIRVNNLDFICKIIILNTGLLFKTNESDYTQLNPIILGKVILSIRKEN
jgi:transcriptional regulator with XRE-family HTH domain